MQPAPSRWNLLRPKWVLLLLLTVTLCVVMIGLGRWQWHAAIRHHGEIMNYSYAFQWWAFATFTLLMYLRIVRDFLRSGAGAEPAATAQEPPTADRYLAYVAPPSVAAEEIDPERIRFNDYLASLYRADADNGTATQSKGTTG